MDLRGKRWMRPALWGMLVACFGSTGCFLHEWGVLPPEVPPAPVETVELVGDELQPLEPPAPDSAAAELAGAHEYYRRGDYSKATSLYKLTIKDKKVTQRQAQEAMFYAGEAYRLDGNYPKAAEYYTLLMTEYPTNPFAEQAKKQMFEIANYWLDDTRAAMKASQRGEREWVPFARHFHWDKSKPFTDEEGRAVQLLEQVHYSDISNQHGLGDRALFLAGGVAFFNENYVEADHYFTQLTERHPNSELAPKALEYAILAKHISTGGPDYDGRKAAEARMLIDTARRSYPEMAREKAEQLERQIAGITMEQAAKDFKKGEHYRRRGHPGSAFFYYALVRKRFPGTPYAAKAEGEMQKLMEKYPEMARNMEAVNRRAAETPRIVEEQPEPQPQPENVPPPPPSSVAPPPRALPPTLR